MRNPALVLLFLVLTISCSRKILTTPQSNIPGKISISSIKTDNISEEITGNDEIQVMFWLMKDSIPVPFLLKEYQDTFNFAKKDLFQPQKIAFEQTFQRQDKIYLITVLIEVDTEKSLEERKEQVRRNLQWANFQPHDSLQTKLYQDLLDDDLLGIYFHKLSVLSNKPEGEFIFSGIHLFDKYYYRVKYELK